MKLRLPAKYLDLKLRHLQTLETTDDPVKRVQAVAGLTDEEIRKMPRKLITEGDRYLQSLQKEEEAVHLKVITLEGVTYGFIPNWEEFSAGEWIDMQTYTQDFWPNAHKAMSLLYRPIVRQLGDKYTIEPYTAKEDPEPFLDMPAPLVAGALLFFWSSELTQLNDLASSLIRKTREAMTLVQNGAGTPPSTNWLTRTFSKWRKSPSSASDSSLRTSPSSKTLATSDNRPSTTA